jgi:hypothetical protein
MSTVDRIAEGYVPDFDIDAAVGEQGVLFVATAMDAIHHGESAEVKTDEASWRTGNVYIELECWVSGQWVPSGVNRQAALWAHVVANGMVIFAPREQVKAVALKYGQPREYKRGSHPTRGLALPIPQFTAALVRAVKASTNESGNS